MACWYNGLAGSSPPTSCFTAQRRLTASQRATPWNYTNTRAGVSFENEPVDFTAAEKRSWHAWLPSATLRFEPYQRLAKGIGHIFNRSPGACVQFHGHALSVDRLHG